MPEHVHLLVTPALDVTLERAIQLIKGGYSHALGSVIGRKSEMCQRGFSDHRIRDQQDFIHHQNYIHQNPVARKIVNNPGEYRYCSAYPGFKLDPWPAVPKARMSLVAEIGTLRLAQGRLGTRALPGSHDQIISG